MTLTAYGIKVRLYLAGVGKALIDWGDGTERETYSLPPYDEKSLDFDDKIEHIFPEVSEYMLTIVGENITRFDCSGRYLSQLDVSSNAALVYLNCSDNRLTELDVSNNVALKILECGENQLTALDVRCNTALKILYCAKNQLTTLDVCKNTELLKCDIITQIQHG